MTLYRIRAHCVVDFSQQTPDASRVQLRPPVLSAVWHRNPPHEADTLRLSIGYTEAGVDPRLLQNARVLFWLWDDERTDFAEATTAPSFVGIVKRCERRLSDSEAVVEIEAVDLTTLFLENKPFPPTGKLLYTDSLATAWATVCDYTGYYSPDKNEIISSVEALRTRIVFDPPSLRDHTFESLAPPRWKKLGTLAFPAGADSWGVWRTVVESLGLVTFIEGDQCVVTTSEAHYASAGEANPPLMIWGANLLEFSQTVDLTRTAKGICLQSFDSLKGQVIEAFYPPPGDPRLKAKRATAGGVSDEPNGTFDRYIYPSVCDQQALNNRARQAYEERARQEIKGRFKTVDVDFNGRSLFELHSGDTVVVDVDPESQEELDAIPTVEKRIEHLRKVVGYPQELAELVAVNSAMSPDKRESRVFHIRDLQIEFGPTKFEVTCNFHNSIRLVDDGPKSDD